MNPALKALAWAVGLESASVAMLAFGGLGPCGPSNPLGLIAMLFNIFPGAAFVFGLQSMVRAESLSDTVCEILAVTIQVGFYGLVFYWRFRKGTKARVF
jgi:hypothetical protein